MKKFQLFFWILFSSAVFSQNIPIHLQDTLTWRKDFPLEKNDFKAKPVGSAAGLASTGIYLMSKQDKDGIVVVVEAVFLKSKSFLKTGSDYALRHEQGHFDICELYARKLRQKIAAKNFRPVKNFNAEIKKIYKQVLKSYEKEQEKYDRETAHSINVAKQESWNEKIARELKELDSYSASEIKVMK